MPARAHVSLETRRREQSGIARGWIAETKYFDWRRATTCQSERSQHSRRFEASSASLAVPSDASVGCRGPLWLGGPIWISRASPVVSFDPEETSTQERPGVL